MFLPPSPVFSLILFLFQISFFIHHFLLSLQLLFLQLFFPVISSFYSCPSLPFTSLSSPNKKTLPFFSILYAFFPASSHTSSLVLLVPSVFATVLLFQLRSQLFPPSTPSFPWRGPPTLRGAPSLPCFRGQPADVTQHLFLLHRQGEVMSRLVSFAQPVCVSESMSLMCI